MYYSYSFINLRRITVVYSKFYKDAIYNTVLFFFIISLKANTLISILLSCYRSIYFVLVSAILYTLNL